MEIKITEAEFDLIENILVPESIQFIRKDDCCLIIGNKETFELLMDCLADFLTEKGINEEGELNLIGNRIEIIIDKISNKMY